MRLQAEVGWEVGDETRGPRVHEDSVDRERETGSQGRKGQLLYRVAVELQDTGARCLTRFFAE